MLWPWPLTFWLRPNIKWVARNHDALSCGKFVIVVSAVLVLSRGQTHRHRQTRINVLVPRLWSAWVSKKFRKEQAQLVCSARAQEVSIIALTVGQATKQNRRDSVHFHLTELSLLLWRHVVVVTHGSRSFWAVSGECSQRLLWFLVFTIRSSVLLY